jgi:hypothetical protein
VGEDGGEAEDGRSERRRRQHEVTSESVGGLVDCEMVATERGDVGFVGAERGRTQPRKRRGGGDFWRPRAASAAASPSGCQGCLRNQVWYHNTHAP